MTAAAWAAWARELLEQSWAAVRPSRMAIAGERGRIHALTDFELAREVQALARHPIVRATSHPRFIRE